MKEIANYIRPLKQSLFIGFFALIMACSPEEELLPGRFLTDQVGIANMISEGGVDYQYQLYFDLSSASVKAQNKRNVWDLAFSCDRARPDIMVNSAMLQSVAPTGSTDFNQTYNPANFSFQHERSWHYFRKGMMRQDFDTTTDRPQGEVFVINLGRDMQSNLRGHLKLQITDYNTGSYTVRFAGLDGSNEQQINITTDDTYNFQHVSFAKPDVLLTLEPPKREWDLFFTRYMARLWGGEDTLNYSVTGCMINKHEVQAYYAKELSEDNTTSYKSITLNDVVESKFSTASDVIGFDWKSFSLDNNAFSVNSNKIYFVKDEADQIYRLRFVSFYDSEGRKGGNTFEYLPL